MLFEDRAGCATGCERNIIKGYNYGFSTKTSSHVPGPVQAIAFPSGGTEQSAEFLKGGASYSWGDADHDWPNEYLSVDYGEGLSFIPQTIYIPREHCIYLHFPFGTNFFNRFWNYVYCVGKENNKKNGLWQPWNEHCGCHISWSVANNPCNQNGQLQLLLLRISFSSLFHNWDYDYEAGPHNPGTHHLGVAVCIWMQRCLLLCDLSGCRLILQRLQTCRSLSSS
ncbi:uncharacterized protein LOC144218871 [Crocuta crocuta]